MCLQRSARPSEKKGEKKSRIIFIHTIMPRSRRSQESRRRRFKAAARQPPRIQLKSKAISHMPLSFSLSLCYRAAAAAALEEFGVCRRQCAPSSSRRPRPEILWPRNIFSAYFRLASLFFFPARRRWLCSFGLERVRVRVRERRVLDVLICLIFTLVRVFS